MKKYLSFILFFLSLSVLAFSQDKEKWRYYVDLKKYLTPFWSADTIYDEAVQPIKKDNGYAEAHLLFKAKKILSVKDIYLDKDFKRKKDWKYKNGKIRLPCKSSIPFFTQSELFFTNKIDGLSMESNIPDHYVLWSEGGLLQSKQLLITYTKEKDSYWNGPVPTLAKAELPHTLSKLENKEPVKIVFYGNSIETGANASGFLNQPPYIPSWLQMVIYNLRFHYGGKISYKNNAVGGKLADWGVENADSLVAKENPDLVVIGFGMNDGTFKVPVSKFKSEIEQIMEKVKQINPSCEFILITTILANPKSIQNQIQEKYRLPILSLEKEGIAIADMTGVHKELLKHKAYQSMTGNNINHTNDYLTRWYAQVISALLIP